MSASAGRRPADLEIASGECPPTLHRATPNERHTGSIRFGHAVAVTTLSELSNIASLLHDEWFHIERLEHNAEHREVRLPIYAGRWKKRWFIETGQPPEEPTPPPTATLVVRNVTDVSVKDDADVGWYGVSHLEHDQVSGELRIISNIPCEVVVETDELDVELLRP